MATPRDLDLTTEILRRLAMFGSPEWEDLRTRHGPEVFAAHILDLSETNGGMITTFETANLMPGRVDLSPVDITDSGRRFLQDLERPFMLQRAKALSQEGHLLDVIAASIAA